MATIPVRTAAVGYDARKLHEVFRTCDVPSRRDQVAVPPSSASEAPRMGRFRRELNNYDANAMVVFAAALVLLVCLVAAID